MKILYINHTNTISGAGISLSTLLASLPAEVEKCFCIHRKSKLADRFGATSHQTYRDPFLSLLHTTVYGGGMPPHLTLFHYLKSPLALITLFLIKWFWKPDVVHLNETVLTSYAVAASFLKLPLVVHARTPVNPSSIGMRLLDKVAERGNCRFISIDGETHASLPLSCQKMGEIIYNPILLSTATTAEIKAKRRDWDLPDGAIAVGQLASLHKEKGIWRILQIAKTICPSNPMLHFVLAGDTDSNLGEGPAFARAVAEAGLADRIHLVGYESNLAVAYGALDIVLCLFGEYLNAVGRTAYEAPLAGKPLIATLPHPDSSTSLLQGVTGLGFECLDFEGVTRAIVDLSQNPGKRQALGESARAAIAERHSPQRHARKVLNVYHRLLGNAGHDDDQ